MDVLGTDKNYTRKLLNNKYETIFTTDNKNGCSKNIYLCVPIKL